MKKKRLAVIGVGRLGRKCVETILSDQTTEMAGVVRRPESAPASWLKVPVATHVSELHEVDAALVCVPLEAVAGTAQALLQSRIPVIECARLHGEAFLEHKSELHRVALHHKVTAVVGAGCDPGALSLFRSQFALLAPHGHTETRLHAGTSLHHTLAADGIRGVKNALATEQRSLDGTLQRYVYVELEPMADATEVASAIANDPLFLGEKTQVFVVPSLAALGETDRGVMLERRAAAGGAGHDAFLLEARYDEAGLAARMMLAAARALPFLQAGAYSLLDLPPGALWGERRPVAEKDWI